MRGMMLLLALLVTALTSASCLETFAADWADRYDVEWTEPSKNRGMDSMPFGGGDIGCNIWVENGEVFLYAQKAGSFNELGEYVKLGRFRLQFSPNPFAASEGFHQAFRAGCCYGRLIVFQNALKRLLISPFRMVGRHLANALFQLGFLRLPRAAAQPV